MSDTQTSDGSLFNTGVRPAIDEWLLAESRKVRDYGDYWSASSAGYCWRKQIFGRLGVPKVETEDDARQQRVFTAGHLFHEWIQGITKQAGVSLAQETELQDESIMVRGHFDDLIQTRLNESGTHAQLGEEIRGRNIILYDYKTRNSKNFDFAKRPSYFHKMQLMTYVYVLRQQGLDGVELSNLKEARTLNIEKDTLRMIEVAYIYGEEIEKEVLAYWDGLNDAWREYNVTGKLPRCTCADKEGGFAAKERWNPYFYNNEPCSKDWHDKWREQHDAVSENTDANVSTT